MTKRIARRRITTQGRKRGNRKEMHGDRGHLHRWKRALDDGWWKDLENKCDTLYDFPDTLVKRRLKEIVFPFEHLGPSSNLKAVFLRALSSGVMVPFRVYWTSNSSSIFREADEMTRKLKKMVFRTSWRGKSRSVTNGSLMSFFFFLRSHDYHQLAILHV